MHRDWQEAARWVSDEELRPAFTTVVTVIEISPDPSARIEADIDEGEIRASKGDAVVPITEIELELKKGDPRMLFDVALQLLKLRQSAFKRVAKLSEVIDCLNLMD